MCLCHVYGHVVGLSGFENSEDLIISTLGGSQHQEINVVLEMVLELEREIRGERENRGREGREGGRERGRERE